MFIDYVKIKIQAGQGGSGCTSFHREKFIDKGGPDGGDGGRGGSIVLQGDRHLRTLKDYTYRREYKAKRGQHGMGSNKHGKSGADIFLKVPLGTMVKDADSGRVLADIMEDGQKFVLAKGGKGGRGNARFSTPTHRSPREWEVGQPGESLTVEFEMKLIADIGLVGLPNAGKSTLLSRISAARPKIADYPFTTLEPNLGIVPFHDHQSFVVADIPGLIEGAHEGKGLGHQFLRHIERTRALAYLIDSTEENPSKVLKTLQIELSSFSDMLIKKPAILVLTKTDILSEPDKKIKIKTDLPKIQISSVAGENLNQLKEAFYQLILEAAKQEEVEE